MPSSVDVITLLLKDSIATRTALLDQAQAELKDNAEVIGEETAQDIQDQIDEARFQVECDRLQLNARLQKKF